MFVSRAGTSTDSNKGHICIFYKNFLTLVQSDTNRCELLFLCLELVKVSLAWVQKADCCASVVVDLSVFYFTLQGFSSKLCYVTSLDCLRGECVVSVPICVAINVSY